MVTGSHFSPVTDICGSWESFQERYLVEGTYGHFRDFVELVRAQKDENFLGNFVFVRLQVYCHSVEKAEQSQFLLFSESYSPESLLVSAMSNIFPKFLGQIQRYSAKTHPPELLIFFSFQNSSLLKYMQYKKIYGALLACLRRNFNELDDSCFLCPFKTSQPKSCAGIT